ncbi:MAG: hypothetical protein R3185_02080 [Candidatus Thermoplasmatota archaeon]|nr:hypothetical protein [Candidatus Thermoplasmatota archaeon]
MAVKSWHLAVGGVVPAFAGACYLGLWSAGELLFSGMGAGSAAALGLAGFVFLAVVSILSLTPAPFLAFRRTRWIGAALAIGIALGLLSVSTVEHPLTLWTRIALTPAMLGLLGAAFWSLVEHRRWQGLALFS